MKIRIFTWDKLLKEGNRSLWFPLLFELYHLKNTELSQSYSLVDSLENANVFILPLDIGWFFRNRKQEMFLTALEEVKLHKKKMWIYSAGDYGKTINDENVYTFRLGGFDSKLNRNTFILPSFINDPIEIYEIGVTILDKPEKPTIGFTGRANNSTYSYLYDIGIFLMLYFRRLLGHNYVDHQSFFSSSRKRFILLEKLKRDKNLVTDFIYRAKYKAGVKKEDDRLIAKKQFLNNIQENVFTFCYRGQGNYSVRLYEVLSMGRIPILVESDFRLPLPWKDWESHIIRCGEDNINDRIYHFYSNLSEDYFKNLQINNRKFWEENLTRTGFFNEIHDYFIKNVV